MKYILKIKTVGHLASLIKAIKEARKLTWSGRFPKAFRKRIAKLTDAELSAQCEAIREIVDHLEGLISLPASVEIEVVNTQESGQ